MKKVQTLFAILTVLATLAQATVVQAKIPAVEITVSGPGLLAPVRITDPDTLSLFDPWARDGGFVDWRAPPHEAAPPAGETYEVWFYGFWDRTDHPQVFYAFLYRPNLGGERGYIYLPGPGDAWHEVNSRTMTRGGYDGKWHNAQPAWDQLVRPLLAERLAASASLTQGPATDWNLVRTLVIVSGGMLAVGIFTWLFRIRQRRAAA